MQYKFFSREVLGKIWHHQKIFAILFLLWLFLVIVILVRLFTLTEYRSFLYVIMLLGFLPPIIIAIIIGITTGWIIGNDNIAIFATGVKTKMHISSLEVAIIDDSSEWYPRRRTGGAEVPGLLASGICCLRNNVKASLIQHLRYKKFVIIQQGGRYYLIGHPGIEELYNELIRLGAREKFFVDCEVKK